MTLATAPLLLGARSPRVECRPAAAGSHGDVAVELAAAAGIALEPWQADGLDLMLGYRSDGKWAAFEHAELIPRQCGKTQTVIVRALTGFLLLGEHRILWSAHQYRTAMESFASMKRFLLALGHEVRQNVIDIDGVHVKVNNTNGDESFERLDTGAVLKLIARSKGSARGFSGDLQVIDEAFAYTAAQQEAQMPTQTARPNPQIVYASSPPLDRWSGEVLFALRARALAGDDALGYRDWGLALDLEQLTRMGPTERSAFLDDRANWAAANPALGLGRVSEESIGRNRRSMTEEGFARECLGCWPVPAAEGGQLPKASWQACLDQDSVPERCEVVAVDAALDRSSAVLVLAGRREVDDLPHVEVIDQRAGMEWVRARCVELAATHGCEFVVDPTGPAGPLAPDLLDAGLVVRRPDGREWVAACAALYDAVIEGRLRHRGQPQLDDAVAVARRRDVGDGAWAWARRRSGGDISALAAATGALWGLRRSEAYDLASSFW